MGEVDPARSSAQEKRSGVLAVVRRYRTLLAVLVGLSLPATRVASDLSAVPVADTIELTVLAGIYLLVLATLCWPLTSYATALRLSLVSAIALVCAGTVNVFVREPGDTSIIPWIVPVGIVFVFSVFCAGAFAALSGLVFVRMRYWPVYGPGQCQRCGYNLFALQSARCPECGTPFASKKVIEERMREREHCSRPHRMSQEQCRAERLS